ncbi:hypothetical protein [Paracoccus litorisediminis]|uniref:Phospholipase D-like domain-containing protein n=1 Tax=Paracoccus litorisediminis TaxID=2006130 RepID=A0A844HSN3_9RHOB|nr:hypothetical protein [Paracoccus litorisediminis]MTH62098.1 hypothetical protein [Paracoccus litorisediminis]
MKQKGVLQGGRPRALRFESEHGTRRVVHRTGNAARVIGPLAPGIRVTGLTAGQFSAIDIMEHMVEQLGPASVAVSTWTSGIYDVQRTRDIKVAGRINDIRFLLDRANFEKSPKFAGPMIDLLGVEAFRCAAVHAKVVIVHGERGAAVMRGSMNLNKNLRTEQFDIDVDQAVADFYLGWFDALWTESGRSHSNVAIMQAVYDRFLDDPDEEDARPSQARRSRDDETTITMDEIAQWT